ncbi:MAG TPA: PHB depolymerase family esterase [Vicinamibacterales bacterium]|nr:PHB depolymerase family esterase [Vicinamibacterales bacterium]
MRPRCIRALAIAAAVLAAGTRDRDLSLQAFPARSFRVQTDEGTRRVALTFQNRVREYLLHVPATPNGALVLAFHGGGSTAEQMERISALDALADREHFIVAYPEAFERSWADGRNETSAEKRGVDDVGFAKAVVADIGRTHPVDRSRVFATGLSNGAILTHRLACEAADVVAAIAPVIGAITRTVAASCRPSAPVAVVGIQGVADPAVSFEGGGPAGEMLYGSRATQELWRSLNGCSPAPNTMALPVVSQDGTSVERRTYANCRARSDVVWYEIRGGGHRWPPHLEGQNEAFALRENGVSSQNLNASEVIWAFFSAHPRQ